MLWQDDDEDQAEQAGVVGSDNGQDDRERQPLLLGWHIGWRPRNFQRR
jgi:hypothetical protein